MVVAGQALQQVKRKKYAWGIFSLNFLYIFCSKKKKRKKIQPLFPSAIHLASLLIPLDGRVLIQAHTKPLGHLSV